MEAIHDWIAPILIRALDEYLEATDSKYLHVEDDLSNLYIHCGNVEFVQRVEVRASPDLQTDIPLPISSSLPRTRYHINMWPG